MARNGQNCSFSCGWNQKSIFGIGQTFSLRDCNALVLYKYLIIISWLLLINSIRFSIHRFWNWVYFGQRKIYKFTSSRINQNDIGIFLYKFSSANPIQSGCFFCVLWGLAWIWIFFRTCCRGSWFLPGVSPQCGIWWLFVVPPFHICCTHKRASTNQLSPCFYFVASWISRFYPTVLRPQKIGPTPTTFRFQCERCLPPLGLPARSLGSDVQ